ncbi:hypothetical protein [Erysipelothrix tonsillarum]|uniref:hypothetical protein n=1 Tax=Erysipelothrix tonsillarum TaxID=38402 RepID=UPI0039C7D3CD
MIDRVFKNTEVLTIVSHLLITVGILIGYIVVFLLSGESDVTLQNLLLLAGGFWFGLSAKAKTDKSEEEATKEGEVK